MDYKEYQAKVKELQKSARDMQDYIFKTRVELAKRMDAKEYTFDELSTFGQLTRAECAIKTILSLSYEL